MFDRMEMFRLSGALASHAGQRQGVTAQNIAQADTPGYRAARVEGFAQALGEGPGAMRATRPGHLGAPLHLAALGAGPAPAARVEAARILASPDGNSVSIEAEMAVAARARADHDMALGIYRSGLSVLRASLGRR